ncbi:MAG TPA: ABC transporter ATP-binding protein [Symbiobacteriaceae bacterium]|nr:ABC transporter ATP-binding protein [Symbiobacteriaceae bacterium]
MSVTRSYFRFIAAVVKTSPATALLLVLISLLMGLRPAAEFWSVQRLIDHVVAHAGPGFAWAPALMWAGILVALALAGEGARQAEPYLVERLRQDAEVVLEGRLLEWASQAPLLDMESAEFFDRLTRAREGLRQHIFMVLEQTTRLLTQALTISSVLGVLAAAHWSAALIMAAAAVPTWFLRRRSADLVITLYFEQTERGRRADYLFELLTQRRSAQEVRLFGLAPEILRRWRKEAHGALAERLRLSGRLVYAEGGAGLLGTVAYCFAVVILGLLAAARRFSVGGLAASLKAAQDLQQAVAITIWEFSSLRRSSMFVAHYWEFMDRYGLPVGVDPWVGGAPTAEAPDAAEVVCRGVAFAYPGTEKPVLEGISFRVQPGELIALVGENGAGKSTLVKLLMGLYPPAAGEVTVNGVDPYGPQGAGARARIASVFQDFNRYSLTTGENIGVGEAALAGEHARIEAAAAGSGADQVVAALPRGYETILGKEWEGGEELSGGQWQKLAIARGYMRRANLLVLDEPTAALDPQAEFEVFRRFRQLVAGRTGFLISHRLGAARLADRIFVMKGGRLVEAGTHEVLMDREGEYAALFRAQAEWYL